MNVTINGEAKDLPEALTVAELLTRLGIDRRKVAVEVNETVVPVIRHAEHQLKHRCQTEEQCQPWLTLPTRRTYPPDRNTQVQCYSRYRALKSTE